MHAQGQKAPSHAPTAMQLISSAERYEKLLCGVFETMTNSRLQYLTAMSSPRATKCHQIGIIRTSLQ
jgi:hypothetical protein